MLTISLKRLELFKNTPTILEAYNLTPDQKWWVEYQSALSNVGRSLMTTPNVPKARVAYLRKIFDEILHDPKLVAEANKRRRFIRYTSAENLEKFSKNILAGLSPAKMKEVKHVIVDKFYQ